jgi:hypothetical protein
VVLSRKSTREILSEKGENIRRQKPLHISANITTTLVIIATLMAIPRKSVGNYI